MERKLRLVYRLSALGLANIENKSKNKSTNSIQYTILIAEINQEPVATIQYSIEREILQLYGLSVHEDFRRKGIARAVLSHCVTIAKTKNLTSIRFSTMKEKGNVQIFKRIGFNEKSSVLCEGLNGEKVMDVQMEMVV